MRQCKSVDVNKDVYEAYKNPPVVVFEELRSSPKQRRVSVSGVVDQVSLIVGIYRMSQKKLQSDFPHQ